MKFTAERAEHAETAEGRKSRGTPSGDDVVGTSPLRGAARVLLYCSAFSACLASSAVEVVPQDAKATLEWGWTKDAKLRYDLAMAVDIDFGGVPMKQDIVLGLAWTVKAVDADGAADLAVLIDRAKIVMAGMMETEYDSDADAEPDSSPVSEFMAALLDQKFALKISKLGEVLEVKGLAEVVKAAAGGKERAQNMLVANLKKLLAEKQVKALLQQLLLRLPEKAVGAGDSWKSEVAWTVPVLGKIKLANEYLVKEIDEKDKLAVIKIKVKPGTVADEDGLGEVTEIEAKGGARWNYVEKRLSLSECFLAMKANLNGQEAPVSMAVTMAWSPREAKAKPSGKPKPKPKPRDE
jgi:hypothetical protein